MSTPRSRPETIPLPVLALAIRAAWHKSPRDGMILETLLETAIRNSECRLLEVGDVWRAGDVVLSLRIREETAKNGKRRTVPLTGSFRQKMRTYIMESRSTPEGPEISEPLFPSTRGDGHLTRRGLIGIVRKHLTKAGWDGTPHLIRHTAATELLRVSNVRVVQIMLGHSRLETVQIYTHPSDDDLRLAQERRNQKDPLVMPPKTAPSTDPSLK